MEAEMYLNEDKTFISISEGITERHPLGKSSLNEVSFFGNTTVIIIFKKFNF